MYIGRQRRRDLDDIALAAQAKGGDTDAFELLVTEYQELAFRVAYLITGDAASAEDAAQEAFVKAYYGLSRFAEGAPFRPWFLRIVGNEARNRRKASARRLQLAVRAGEGLAGADEGVSLEAVALQHERQELLATALAGLREEDRLVLSYRYFLDLSEAEMASLLEVAQGTVKSRLSRALARLRTQLHGHADLFDEAAELQPSEKPQA